MKHWLKQLICLMLALSLLIPAALAEELPVLQELDASSRMLFVHSGALHSVTWDNMVYRQGEAGWTPIQYLNGNVQFVDATDDAVWTMTRQEGEPASFLIERAAFAPDGSLGKPSPQCTIQWELDADAWPMCAGLIVEGSEAFLLMEDPFDWHQRALYRVDLESGAGTRLLADHISGLRRYKDGLLIARRFSWDEYDLPDGTHYPPQIVAIDPAAGTMATLGLMNSYNDGALTYDAQNDEIYFRGSSRVYRVNGDTPEAVGSLIPGEVDVDNATAVMFNGRYYMEDYDGLISSSVDPSAMPQRTLRITYVMGVEDYVRGFAKLHPEIVLELVDDFSLEAEAIIRDMQSSAAADLYCYSVSTDFVNMRDKHYLLDLSGSDILMDAVNRMDPHLTAEIHVGDSLYAVPYAMAARTIGWYPDVFAQMGLSAPETYGELLDCVEAWLESNEKDDLGIRFFDLCADLHEKLFRMIYKARVLNCQAAGETPTFNTPEVRALLERLETLRLALQALEPVDSWSSEDAVLFAQNEDVLPRAHALPSWAAKPLLLRMDEASSPVVEADMELLFVNPYSENADLAMELLEYIVQHLPEALETALMPERNDPIEVESYQENLAYLHKLLAEYEGRLDTATGEELDIVKSQIESLRMDIDHEERHQWAYTAEELAFYRESIEPNIIYALSPVFSRGREQMDNICSRYLDGQLSLDMFVQEFDRVVWMITMENQ